MPREPVPTGSRWMIYTTDPAKGPPLESAPLPLALFTPKIKQRNRQMCGLAEAEPILTPSPIGDNSQPAEQEIPSIISHLPQFEHLLCSPCRSVVPYKMLYHHLRHHHNICHAFCKAIVSQYENVSVSQTDADVAPLPAGTPPLECLPSPEPGYFCPHCDYTTVNWGSLLHHFRKTQCDKERRTRDDLSCFLQRWVSVRKNVGKAWRVDTTIPVTQRETDTALSCDQPVVDDPATIALLRMEAEEEARLLREEQESMSLSNELEHDEKTDWLRGCGWPRWFAHKPLHLIIATAKLPPSSGEGVHLGTWNCMEWIHCAPAETRLRRLIGVVALVLDRCEETLQQTPRVLRCWLRSWGSHFYAYPFELPQREATRARYRSYFNRFLCYVFRAWQVCKVLNQSLGEVYGLRLSEMQVRTMESIWAGLAVEEPNSLTVSSSSHIAETVFQLLVMFWTDLSTDGLLEGKAIVVSADVAGEPGFLKYAGLLSGKKLLRRVVVDECHLIFTLSNWRPKLAKLRNLRVHGSDVGAWNRGGFPGDRVRIARGHAVEHDRLRTRERRTDRLGHSRGRRAGGG